MQHLAGGMDARIGAPGSLQAQFLAAEGLDGPLDSALNSRQVVLRLITGIGASIIFDGQLVAGHQPTCSSARRAKPRTNSSASCAPLPSRWARSRRTAPSPQAI